MYTRLRIAVAFALTGILIVLYPLWQQRPAADKAAEPSPSAITETVVPEISPTPSPFLPLVDYEEVLLGEFESGNIYQLTDGYIYLPHEISADTCLTIYYPGFKGEPVIKDLYWKIEYYFENFAPDTIIYFSEGSAFRDMEQRNPKIFEHIEQIRGQYGIEKPIVICGSSLGSYAAMHMAAQLGHQVSKLLCLDCGLDYNVDRLLNDEQMEALAHSGTPLYLFEQIGVDNADYDYIQKLVDAGVKTFIAECSNGDHSKITENAFNYDVFSWAIGDGELSEKEYRLKELSNKPLSEEGET